MKLKVVVLEEDREYIRRFSSAFSDYYADKFEVYCFSDKEKALSALKERRIDIFLVGETFDFDENQLPPDCAWVYLVASKELKVLKGRKTICKYQQLDSIAQQITSVYADSLSDEVEISYGGDSRPEKIIAFVSPTGGVGVTSVSLAFAKFLAAQNRKVFYLNLDAFDSTDHYFEDNGAGSMEDVIFLLKRKDSHLALKIKRYIKRDLSGVNYLSSTKNAIDMLDIEPDDIKSLLQVLHDAEGYEYIIIDFRFGDSPLLNTVLDLSHKIVFLSDGTKVSNAKFARAYTALSILEQQQETKTTEKISLLYNKFSRNTGTVITDERVLKLGGIRRFENVDSYNLLSFIMAEAPFEQLM